MFECNHGKDTLTDEEGNDVIKFYQHTEKEKIQFHRSEDDSLVITFDGDSANNSTTVKKYFSDRQFKIEAVEVNGQRW